MAGRNHLDIHPSEAALAEALRALPQSAPQPDLWPALARTLEQRRRPRAWRYAIPFAAAAAIALAVLLPKMTTQDRAAPQSTPIASSAAPQTSVSTPDRRTPASSTRCTRARARSNAGSPRSRRVRRRTART